jgi:hypothetical protein
LAAAALLESIALLPIALLPIAPFPGLARAFCSRGEGIGQARRGRPALALKSS